jgi:hypothetical protein
MLKSPLIQTLQLLSQEEFETLYLFVASPLFNEVNRYHDTVALFEYIRLHYPGFDHPDLAKDQAGIHLFPDRKNPKAELEKAMSHLMRVVRQFITFQHFAIRGSKKSRSNNREDNYTNPVSLLNFARQQLALMRFYSERLHQIPMSHAAKDGEKTEKQNTENFFLNLYDKLNKELGAVQDFSGFEGYEHGDYLYYNFLLEQEKALYDSLEQRRDGNRNLLHAIESLDQFYLVTKLDMLCKIMHQVKMAIPFSKDPEALDRLKANLKSTLHQVHSLAEESYLQSPIIVFYCTLLECLTHEDPLVADAAADRFYLLIKEGSTLIPAQNLQDYKVVLRSYWARRSRHTREPRFSEKVFMLQSEQLKEMHPEEVIPASQLHNILATAIKLNKPDEAESILNSLQFRIVGSANPEILRGIWWTMLRLAQSRFEEAATLLPHYYVYGQMDDIIFYSWAAILDIKIRYELDTLDDDVHSNMVRATSARIERDKTLTPDARRERELFFPMALKLYKLKQKIRLKKGNHTKDLQGLHADIAVATVVHKEWLLEKCSEIESILRI